MERLGFHDSMVPPLLPPRVSDRENSDENVVLDSDDWVR